MNSETPTKEILDTLERLEHQLNCAIEVIKVTGVVSFGGSLARFKPYPSTPNTFEVGDFIVTYRQWTKC